MANDAIRDDDGRAANAAEQASSLEPSPPGRRSSTDGRLWQRLNMDRVARRLIQTAQMAAAEHAMSRLQEAIRQRDGSRG
jgi:hypothetical protein